MADLARRIREVVEQERPDLLHAHSPVLNALPALWVGRRLGIPVVYEIRAFWEDAAVDHGTYRQDSWQYRLVHAVESWVCRKADHVAVICQGLKGDLIERGMPAEHITVVANGIDLGNFHACPSTAEHRNAWGLAGKQVIGFIGSFYHYEGLDLLVDAVAHLTATRSDIVLFLVGDGPMAAALKAQIGRLRLEERVILPGKIPHDRIAAVYASMDILAYPRHSMRLTELVTPLKPLEAMAMGKAVVASDIGGHRELIHHGRTGLLFPAGSVAGLAEAIECLLNHQTLRESIARQATAWVYRERSWDKTTAVYSEIYSKAKTKRPARAFPGIC
jgi:PEP-CTERM/exosortase A-associated glycosyltransferase